MKIRQNFMILTSVGLDNAGLDRIKSCIAENFTDYEPIFIDENVYGGLKGHQRLASFKMFMLRHMPETYKFLAVNNKRFNKKMNTNAKSARVFRFSKAAKRICNAVYRFVPKVILVCDRASLTFALYAKHKCKVKSRVIVLLPNFTLEKSLYSSRADGYIVENTEAKNQLVNMGCSSKKVKVLGMPVSQPLSNGTVVDSKTNFGLSSRPTVFLSGGTAGSSEIIKIFYLLLDQGDYINVVVNCGTNTPLFNRFDNYVSTKDLKNVKVCAQTEETDRLLDVSDVVITVYDNSLIYSCLLKNKPLIVFSPMSEIEKKDFMYLSEKHLAYFAEDENETITAAYRIIQTDLGREHMGCNDLRVNDNSLYDICNYLTTSVETEAV